jgi:PHYB activation tagged suppressor 1
MGMILILIWILFLIALSTLILFMNKVWWTPIRIQSFMKSQGLKGPSYKFLHGNTKEIMQFRKESRSNPMDLSHDIFSRIQPHIYSWIKLYGNNIISWYGPQPVLIITEPDLIKEVLSNKDGIYPKRKMENLVKKLIGNGLLASEGEKWSKLRKLANHTFHAESLKEMIPAMIASVEAMLERWKENEGKEIEICEEFRILTSEVISRTAFGSSYVEGKHIFEMLTKLGLIISRNDLKIRIPGSRFFFKSSDDIESDETKEIIDKSVMEIIKKRENKASTMEGGNERFGNDFLGLLIKAKHETKESTRITVDDIIDECKTFYIAGQETTTTLLSWTILLLAIQTDWQDRARNEVFQSFGREIPNSEGIARLKNINMIINETLRLYNPVVNLIRRVKEKVKLGKYDLPEDLDVLIPPLALHLNPKIWGEDAHLFKPDRFENGVGKATNNNPTAFLPFGFGPRSCVGLSFATAEAKIALSMILQHYKFTLSPTYTHSPIQILTIRPQHGVQIVLQKI